MAVTDAEHPLPVDDEAGVDPRRVHPAGRRTATLARAQPRHGPAHRADRQRRHLPRGGGAEEEPGHLAFLEQPDAAAVVDDDEVSRARSASITRSATGRRASAVIATTGVVISPVTNGASSNVSGGTDSGSDTPPASGVLAAGGRALGPVGPGRSPHGGPGRDGAVRGDGGRPARHHLRQPRDRETYSWDGEVFPMCHRCLRASRSVPVRTTTTSRNGKKMATFVIERNIPGASELTPEQLREHRRHLEQCRGLARAWSTRGGTATSRATRSTACTRRTTPRPCTSTPGAAGSPADVVVAVAAVIGPATAG